ncbi:CAP domain-containing protein [Clostridium sp. AL.422]|uniref:CAP domain-containing protein n=1 Tax=Clostridium TaxID=1485 RepID=UPI00293DF518|nr:MULTISPECIES: CAP domain-containing protein [unclassified Clostridium]MDV4150162.1 CAP domain-containing protein [Clostridium sp. AL.422]
MIRSRLITFITTLILSGTVVTGSMFINSDKENKNIDTIKSEVKEEESKYKEEVKKVETEEQAQKEKDEGGEIKSNEDNVEKGTSADKNNTNNEVAVVTPKPSETEVEVNNRSNTENVVPVEKPAEKPVQRQIEKPVEKPVEKPQDNNTVPNSSNYIAEIEQAIFQRVNQERSAAGLPALSYNTTMEHYARVKSKDMGDNGYFSHEDQQGNLITVKMQADSISYRAWGENIAYIKGMTGNSALATRFMDNWMNSPGHKANILSTKFSSIGVGVYKIGDAYYATQEFYN